MSRHRLEIREVPGGRAFYIDGSLQFDSRDEAVYHEALALPPLALAAARSGRPPAALVLGGGDGLVLRRLLDGGAKRAVLVDYDPGVLALGRGEFSAYNGGALDDKRVKVRAADALKYLAAGRGLFDLALADFTFPEDLAGCSLFTRQFFSSVRARLAAGGLFAMNAVSPDRFPAAFWSVYRTLADARLYPRPLRVSIPSFTAHGYGDWGMFLASPRPIRDRELAALRFEGAWLKAGTFRETLRLRVSGLERGLPLSGIIKKPGDLLCLINLQEHEIAGGGAMADFSDSAAAKRLLAGIPGAEKLRWPQLSAEWEWRLLETMRLLDWEPFLAELEKNAALLPGRALREIRLLRKHLPELLKGAVPDTDRAWQVFALLMTVLVFVNMAYPDNAYAKGSYGGGSGGGGELEITFFMPHNPSPMHHNVFQGEEVLQTLLPSGRTGSAQYLRYRAPEAPAGPAGIKEDRLYFALSDISFVSRNGEFFFNHGHTGYLLNARPDRFMLLDKLLPEPVFEFYPDPAAVQIALGAMEKHIKAADQALAAYDKWLAWAGPAAAFSREVRANSNEAKNIAAIRGSLLKASQRLREGPAAAARPEVPAGWLQLAPGLYLVDNSELVLLNKDGIFFSYPYRRRTGLRYAALPENEDLGRFLTAVLRAKEAQTYEGDPMRAVYAALLADK